MTEHQFDEFLIAVLIICAFGVMLNVAKFPTRGLSAKLLAASFVTLGLGVWLIRLRVAQIWVDLAGAATFGLLAADVAYRMRKAPATPKRKGRK